MASWSGGKDSTASIILAHEHNEPLDEIIFCEVMFDKEQNISGENPYHIGFVKGFAKPMFESWGYKVTILRSDRDYLDFFNRVIERPRKNMSNKGLKFGFPGVGMCGVQRDLKIKPINDYKKKIVEPIIQYIGIGIDEPKRLETMRRQDDKISLLEKYGFTEKMAREKCEEYGLLSPNYGLSKRGGCWFCPNAKLEEQREIKRIYPEAWAHFLWLEERSDGIAYKKFNPFRPSLHEIDKQLEVKGVKKWLMK